jgi:hypothetical protein
LVCPSIFLSHVFLSVCPSMHPSHLSTHVSIHQYICPPNRPFVHPSFRPFINPAILLYTHLPIH